MFLTLSASMERDGYHELNIDKNTRKLLLKTVLRNIEIKSFE